MLILIVNINSNTTFWNHTTLCITVYYYCFNIYIIRQKMLIRIYNLIIPSPMLSIGKLGYYAHKKVFEMVLLRILINEKRYNRFRISYHVYHTWILLLEQGMKTWRDWLNLNFLSFVLDFFFHEKELLEACCCSFYRYRLVGTVYRF